MLIIKYGEPRGSLSERFYPIDTKSFFVKCGIRISAQLIELYQKGLSLRDIASEIGCSKTRIRLILLKAGLELREPHAQVTCRRDVSGGKQGGLPYYGFCYLEGAIVKDPREYPTLKIIHRRWREEMTIHKITQELNQANHPSRKGKRWSWAAVQNIIKRFEAKKIIFKTGGQYEFR